MRNVPEVCDTLVSTDDEAVAAIAREAGIRMPWLRPAELATDGATSVDVALHALDWYEKEKGAVDGLLLLQPTSPFRTRASIERGIDLFRSNNYRPVVSVSPALSHPMRCFRVEGGVLQPFVPDFCELVGSQDLPPAFVVNGAFYLVAPAHLRMNNSFYGTEAVALTMTDPDEGLDIDTEKDWADAESVVGARSKTA